MSEPQENLFSQLPEPIDQPGFLDYWDVRSDSGPEEERVARIVQGLTRVAIRGENGHAEYTNREPALQARYWYRALGPLNPLVDAEPDLMKAAEKMYGQRTNNPEESANLQLDSTYIMAEIARHSDNPQTIREALGLGLGSVRSIEENEQFAEREGAYKLQTMILEGDLRHDAIRFKQTGHLSPEPLGVEEYRDFERAFVQEELRAIGEFGKMIRDGITEENFGVLFEWYFILARRHEAWADEVIDTVVVRGATSRENAEWTGEDVVDPRRVSGNHDIVISTRDQDGHLKINRMQLKTVNNSGRQYHPRVEVLDFHEVLKQRFTGIDQATAILVRNLRKFRQSYVENS